MSLCLYKYSPVCTFPPYTGMYIRAALSQYEGHGRLYHTDKLLAAADSGRAAEVQLTLPLL